MYKKFNVKISGNSLLMHNAQLANPMNPITKQMKAIPRKKTDADLQLLANLEFRGSLYTNSNGDAVIPKHMLEATIIAGSKALREGTKAKRAIFCEDDAKLSYRGGPLSLEELINSPDHRLVVPVNVQKNKIMRTRPMFKDWTAEFEVDLDVDQANESALKNWLDQAGLCGLGDWRPQYGRFKVLNFNS